MKYGAPFDADGGSAVDAQTIEYGKTATKPTDPTKEGYTFKGWYVADKAYDFATVVKADVTLKAKWEAVAADPDPEDNFVAPTIGDGETKIWEGKSNLGTDWASTDTLGVAAEKFADIDADTIIKIYGVVGEESYHQVKICSNKEGWPVLETVATNLEANTYNCINFPGPAISFSLSSTELAAVKANGLRIAGYDVTLTAITVKQAVSGVEASEALYEGTGFKAYEDKFSASTIQGVIDNAKEGSDVTLRITYTFNEYTPTNDWDGVAGLAGWNTSGAEWANTTDDLSAYGLNTGCAIAEYSAKVGTSATKDFDAKALLTGAQNTHVFTVNIYSGKITITKIELIYITK